MSTPSYKAALDYLYSFIDPTRQPGGTPAEAARNLTRMRALLAAAGDPQVGMPAVVVAGTKGKGSSCALIESIARAAGLRTGLWSSPHLSSFRERIQVNRTPIAREELAGLVARLRPAADAFDRASYGNLTTFELGFALALMHFAEQQVELAVIEVGLGGRYDSTNVITPLVSAISSISYDHMHILGTTLAEIADNKAGIAKPGVPLVTVSQPGEAAAVIARVAEETGAPLFIAEETGLTRRGTEEQRNRGTEEQRGERSVPLFLCSSVPPRPALLRGAFQRENARLALGVALLLRERGLPITDEAMAQGLATAWWPGRLELVGREPLIVLDGAHNGDSATKLASALREEFAFERLILVLGTLRDKDLPAIIAGIVPAADVLILTAIPHYRAQADLNQLAELARPYLRGPLHQTPHIAEALAMAHRLAAPTDLICITGSLALVGAAREALGLAEPEG